MRWVASISNKNRPLQCSSLYLTHILIKFSTRNGCDSHTNLLTRNAVTCLHKKYSKQSSYMSTFGPGITNHAKQAGKEPRMGSKKICYDRRTKKYPSLQ